jgi:Rieske 2Fe-2S family protein
MVSQSQEFSQEFAVRVPAAPLNADDLALALKPFGSSRMLPKAAYVDPEVLAWERRTVFSDWICIGRSSEIPLPRMAKAFSVGESGVLVSRDADGVPHAFENNCRHRGHELLQCGETSAQAHNMTCPYHAWVYKHDGSMVGAPGFKRYKDFDRSEFGLHGLPLREWRGWLFVNPSGLEPDFDTHIGDLDGVLSHYDAETLVIAETHEYEVAANWKVVIENYQECYHCAMIHPDLVKVSPPYSGENIQLPGNWVGGNMWLAENAVTMSFSGESKGNTFARLDEEEQRTVMYIAVMPNLLISLHPDYIMTHLLTPLSPDLTRIQCSWAFPPETAAHKDFDPSYAVEFWDLTNRQDWAACESVQRGIKAPGFVPGPLAPDEEGVYHFVTLMARRYLGEAPVGV